MSFPSSDGTVSEATDRLLVLTPWVPPGADLASRGNAVMCADADEAARQATAARVAGVPFTGVVVPAGTDEAMFRALRRAAPEAVLLLAPAGDPASGDPSRFHALAASAGPLAPSSTAAPATAAPALPEGAMEAALAHMRQGLLMLDADGRVTLFNARLAELIGFPPGVLHVGASPRDLVAAAHALGHHGERTVGEVEALWEARLARRAASSHLQTLADGRTLSVAYSPTREGGWVITYDDVTERRQAQDALEEQNRRFDAALNSMAQGLAMFDADERLIVCNEQYRLLYGLCGSVVRPGATLREIIAHGVATHDHTGLTVDELHRRSRAAIRLRQPMATQQTLRDGRAIEIVYRPMPNGGWVSTYEDVSERNRAAERLRAQSDLFAAALANMSHGLLMLDGDLRITAVNGQYLAMYGLSGDKVHVGASVRNLIAHSLEVGNYRHARFEEVWPGVLGRLSTPHAFQREETLGDGRTVAISYRPMPGGGWVTIHQDVTEAKRAEAEIQRQNLRFGIAMDNMVQGLCVFDRDMRLVVCNERYVDLFGLPPHLTRPGTSFLDLLDHRIERNLYFGDPDTYVADRIAIARSGDPLNADLDLRDGRVFAMAHRPLPDGGWLSTFEDITGRKRIEQTLAEQNRRLDAALANMSQGLTMLDADLRITVFNRRYPEMIGLAEDDVRPGVTLREIVERGVARGNHEGRTVDEVLAPRLEIFRRGEPAVLETPLAGDRIVETAYRPMPGGGWVATYEDITERKRAEARIRHMARHDALTDLPNRVLLRERMEEALGVRRREGQAFAVLCLDLDQFKAVNDTLGHPVGDALLKAVAARLGTVVRAGDTIARLGGDEFALIQPLAQPHEAEALARRIIETVSLPYDLDGQHVVIGTSIGIAVAPLDGDDPDILLKNADLALYRAKADGRGTARFFEAEMDAQIKRRRRLEIDLRAAHAGSQFELWYQPQVDAATGAVGGFEALLRWRHPERGLISPADFIPLAEEIGLIVPLGEWVIRTACLEAARWPGDVRVAVNVSAAQFGSRSLENVVLAALAAAGLNPRRLELEITESVLLTDTEATLATLHRLRGMGVRIAMDDFGTGYSSLSYLRRFPFDKIKIDRSFVRDLERADCSAIVEAVAELAAKLGMATTAEGVETQGQLDMVRAKGCTEVQGYLFSPPRPAGHVPALILDPTGRGIRAVA